MEVHAIAATLRDIAERLGVSTQAVSIALNKPAGTGRISPELRARALAAASEMGYRPNRLARALVRGHSSLLGLLMLASADLPYSEALRGIDEQAAEEGYGVLACGVPNAGDAARQLETFADHQVEGIVAVASSSVGLADAVLACKPAGIPLISINCEITAPEVCSIVMDNRGAMHQVTEHLLGLGHQRIAYLDVPGRCTAIPASCLQSSTERREGYVAAMRAAGLQPLIRSLTMQSAALRVSAATAIALELLTDPHPPTAFCSVADYEAMGALCACASLGLRVPEQVAIFGFDDREGGLWSNPSLSSVRPAFYEAGCQAVRRLLNWQEEGGAGVLRLPCQLLHRGSAPTQAPGPQPFQAPPRRRPDSVEAGSSNPASTRKRSCSISSPVVADQGSL